MTLPGDFDKKIAELSPAKRLLLERLRNKGEDSASVPPPITRRPEGAACPLSFAQQRLWFLYRLDPASTLYNVPRALRLRGVLDTAALQQSLNEIVRRHEVLRTTFAMTDDGPVQVIAPSLTLNLPLTDISDSPAATQEDRLQRLAVQEVKHPFDLSNGPVLQARLFRINQEDHLLLIVLHHIVSDGWTGGLFFDELGALYNAAVDRKALLLPEPPLQYADYAIWQRGWLQGDALEQQLSYWRTQLKDTATELILPADHSRPPLPSYRGATHTIELGGLSEQIKTFSQKHGATIFITMVAALKILLFRWTQQNDLVVGTITANRNQMETERLLGCFMNFLPLRSQIAEEITAAEILSRVKQTVLEAYAHQDAPFERLIEEVNPERKLNVNPLYNVSFQYQNFRPFEFSSESLDANFFDLKTNVAFLDLRFIGEETAEGIRLQCEYSTDLFEGETIQLLLQNYARTIDKFIRQPDATVSEFDLSGVLQQKTERARKLQHKRTLAVAATFTAEPLQESLDFWMRELSIDAEIRFAPYDQVFQQLLSSDSLLSTNRDGINIILIRAQDLLGSAAAADAERSFAAADENIRELRAALESAAKSEAAPFLVCLCPSSASAAQDPVQADLFRRVEAQLLSELSRINRVHLLSHADVTRNYPVPNYEDAYRNKLGRVPYTREFFTALGTSIARRIYDLQTPSRQVIVVECDETLWKGSCRDRDQIEVSPSLRHVQEFLAAQAEAGMLLCLCSNNREEDVFAVFEQNPDMVLRREHILASNISLRPKTESLQALADELQIPLDQFLYLDSDAENCAEMQGSFPEVLTVQLPHDADNFRDFLRNIWAFSSGQPGNLETEWTRLASSAAATVTNRIANELCNVPRILEAIESRHKPAARRDHSYVAPGTPIEELLAAIWEKLLRVERIGIHADFFEQGGHSLLATQLLARIRQQFQVELSLRAIFEAPTIAGLAKLIEQQVRGGERLSIPPISRAPRDQRFPLSFGQQRLWFLDQLEPGNATYNLPQRFRMLGTLHLHALAQGLNEVVRRHEVLRTVFDVYEGQPFQVVKPELHLDLPLVDLTPLAASEREAEAQRLSLEEAQTAFDLGEGPVVRAKLFRLSALEHWLVLNTHHVASDRWSMGLFSEELAACYRAILEGKQPQLPELPIQYADYALWQRTWLQGEVLEKQLSYSKEHLRGAPALLELPTDRPRPSLPSYRGSVHSALLPKHLVNKLSDLSQREGVTLFMTLLAAFDTLLFRYTGQEDIVVGSPIANRTSAEVEGLIGFFVNTLALRTKISGDQTFSQLLAHIRGVALDAYAHQDLPFERLVEELQTGRSLSHNPIFQVLFALQNARMQALELPALQVERMPILTGSSMFDMSWFAIEVPEGLLLRVEYNTDLFDDATISRTLTHFQTLLEAATTNPEQRIVDLPLLDEEERHQVVVGFNSTDVDYPLDTCLHQFFEAQVERTPDATALIFEGQQLTYRELNSRANQLAHHLRQLGVKPDDLIGVCTHRSIEMVVALYGVVKAGAAYVPLDPDYPQERLAVMLEDAQPKVLLTQSQLLPILPPYSGTVIALDRDWQEITTASSVNPAVVTTGKNLAYAIYTSGSTGKPKGVPNVHEGIVNRLLWMQDEYQLNPGDRVLQKTPYSFDVSVWEFFWPLMTGATLVVAKPDGHKDPAYLVEVIANQQITTLHFVPSMLQIFLQAEGIELCSSLRLVFCSGEALPYEVQQRFFEVCKAHLHNLYGPTEAAVDVTYWACRPDYTRTLVPIGRPVANTQIYLLDKNLQPVPIGVAGELHIGGIQLARGYLNRPELTAEKFIPDPFSSRPGARLYKTGDLARFLPDGNIEYLGRIDLQVKIRGFRIELGEIEAALDRHTNVRQSVVMAREDEPGDKRLVAYIVPEGMAPATDDLRAHLRTGLPEFMVPAAFVVMESFPLSSNGKVNRRALPAPEYTRSKESEYVAPRNAVEEQIARIWAEVLRVPQVGVNDDFFTLGGHSLLATQVIARMRQAFRADLPLRVIFEAHTVAELAGRVTQASAAGDVAIKLVSRDRDLPLSFAQQRLWFLDQLEPDNPLYNLPWALRLHGDLNVPALQDALNALVARHESLRTVFASVNGQPVQRIQSSLNLRLETTDLSADPSAAARLIAEESARPFNLSTGPLLRARLLRMGNDEHILLLNIHHIVSDRWSMGVLSQELTSLYDAIVTGNPVSLAPLPVQYADFAVWQREQLHGHVYDKQLAYWKEQLQGAPPMLALPTDHPRPAVETFCGDIATITLSHELSQRLNALSQQLGATLFMTLLGAFQVLLSRYSGQDDIVIGAPIANRTRPEFEGLIGFFANTLAFRTRLSGDPSVTELIARVKETSLGAYAHQDTPFEKLVEELRPERSLSRNPLVQVFFALQNVRLESLPLKGLRVEPIPTDTKTAKGDLFFSIVETSSGLRGRVEYNTDLFDGATIARMLDHYQVLLEAMVAHPLRRISQLPLLTSSERKQLLDWNATEFDYPRQLCLHELFEQQVERAPNAIACVYEDQTLTYSELNQRSNQLAHFLKKLGVGPRQRIGLFVERSLEMMVGLLGIQKSGAAYVPLDPSYPAERLRLTLDDAQVPVLLTQRSLLPSMPEHAAEVVCLDADRDKFAAESTANPAGGATSEDLVYVIFTSGSTGRPKGVQVPHRAVVNLLTFMAHELRMGPDDVFPALASFAFDMCIPELYLALVSGGRVILGDRHLAGNGEALAELLRNTGATIVHATPTTWNLLLEAGFTGKGLKRVIGAEALPRDLCTRLLTADPSLYNFYGPTETTVWSAFHHFVSPDEPIVVGRPLANTQIYVLDAHGQPVPVGVPGEIHIAGDGVTCGYLKRPELTAEKFVPDPLSTKPNSKMYKTGDLGRFLPDGRIEFQGRIDNQVKIRGYRIELGEIESVLGKHPAVQECVVIAREDVQGDKRLVGYVVPAPSQTPNAADLRAWVKERVPDYMTPVAFVTMDRFPLSPNGKVDRKQLPAPDYVRPEMSRAYLAARSPAEEVITGIWAEVLKLDQVGINDDFFELGGHSLLATQVVSRIRQAFQVELPLRAMFEAPTVSGLAQATELLQRQKQGLAAPAMTRVSREQDLPLSFAQQRLWFLDQLEPNNPLYNVPLIVRMRGPLQPAILDKSLNEIVRRHEALRTRFESVDDRPVQVIAPGLTLRLEITDLSSIPQADREYEARTQAMEHVKRPFDLATGPLLRPTLLKLADDDHVLILNTHHIISDRWSLGILSQELAALYEAFLDNKPSPLPGLEIQYADYAVWQRQYLSGSTLDQQLQYWKHQLEGAPPTLNLPTSRPREVLQNFWGGTYKHPLPPDLLNDLRSLSRSHAVTFFMTLLAAFHLLLSRWSGQDDVVVGTDLANRTQVETEKLIGFFVNLLPIRMRLSGNPTFVEILERVREVSLGAFAHQDLPFDKLVEELRPERNLTHNPLVQVLFVMQNTPKITTEFGGLKLGPLGVGSTSRFDLVLFINDPDGATYETWMYNPNLFDESTIARVASGYQQLLKAIVKAPQTRLDSLREVLADEEKMQLQAEKARFEQTSLQKLRNVKRKAVTKSD